MTEKPAIENENLRLSFIDAVDNNSLAGILSAVKDAAVGSQINFISFTDGTGVRLFKTKNNTWEARYTGGRVETLKNTNAAVFIKGARRQLSGMKFV